MVPRVTRFRSLISRLWKRLFMAMARHSISRQILHCLHKAETLVYGDGSTLNISTNLTLFAQSGNSTLSGTGGTDTLIAVNGAGTETLLGSGGNDVYLYTAGNGNVIINENGSNSAAAPLKPASGLTSANVSFTETSNGSDLIITDGT